MAAEEAAYRERACSIYRAVACLPTPTKGRLFPKVQGKCEIAVKWTQRDLERGKNISFAKSAIVRAGDSGVEDCVPCAFQNDTTAIIKETFSSDGRLRAVLRKDKQGLADQCVEPQQFIEVWEGDRLAKCISVADLKKKHGKIHEDDHFGCFRLNSDGSKLLYIAERKRPDSASYFKTAPGGEKEEKDETVKGVEYEYRESWGEQLTTVTDPVVMVLEWASGDCSVAPGCTEDISASSAHWLPGSNEELVFVGYSNNPLKLGFVYCFNRWSTLCHANLKEDTCEVIVRGDVYIYSPRFNPEGTKLVYLECTTPPGGVHHSCARMKMVDWASKDISTVVDIVDTPEGDGFTGIYTACLPERCWHGTKLYYHDFCRSYIVLVCVDTSNGAVSYLPSPEGDSKGAHVVMDVSDGLILTRYATPISPPSVLVAALPTADDDKPDLKWTEIAKTETPSVVKGLSWDLMTVSREGVEGSYEALLLLPSSTGTPPSLVVFNHGGPHTCVPTDFLVWPICLAALGYAVVMVNYRGSSGFGQKFVKSLPGKAGTLDVNDIQHVANSLVTSGRVDSGRVVVMGGSHGGFLTTHLIGQFPDFYKAALTRNPVTDISAMYSVTDIPDWSFCESGLPYDPAGPVTQEQIGKMLSVSPITLVDKVKTPIMIALGGEDHRVPPSQGKLYYHKLKALGKKAKLVYNPPSCTTLLATVCST